MRGKGDFDLSSMQLGYWNRPKDASRHVEIGVVTKGFKAPGVVVSYTTDPEIQSGRKFLACRPPPACRCSATKARTS